MMTFTNEHGVVCESRTSGRHFGRRMPDGTIKNYSLIPVPLCCHTCKYYDEGEHGDYGEELSGPICGVNLNFPTRKGTCKRHAD